LKNIFFKVAKLFLIVLLFFTVHRTLNFVNEYLDYSSQFFEEGACYEKHGSNGGERYKILGIKKDTAFAKKVDLYGEIIDSKRFARFEANRNSHQLFKDFCDLRKTERLTVTQVLGSQTSEKVFRVNYSLLQIGKRVLDLKFYTRDIRDGNPYVLKKRIFTSLKSSELLSLEADLTCKDSYGDFVYIVLEDPKNTESKQNYSSPKGWKHVGEDLVYKESLKNVICK